MSTYDFSIIEKKWQTYWEANQIFHTTPHSNQPKYYVLDMFPYPSGEGLHVGHPLGYMASDVVARYKRSKGYAVLHPMGFDAFGLPAEQFAIQTGQHPAVTTAQNITRYKQQLQRLGMSYDWSRSISTADPSYYRWTQWIFLQLFDSWYDTGQQKARPIQELIAIFEQSGNKDLQACCDPTENSFTADEWRAMDNSQQQHCLMAYRLAFLETTLVNWCPALGTVLANEEVQDGLSERGGHPVIRKPMQQWSLRITAYVDRLLEGLDRLSWPTSTKEMQRNWIGKSIGAEITFQLLGHPNINSLTIFTTRPETLFGVTFLVIAPDHPLAPQMATDEQKIAVATYIDASAHRSERERLAAVDQITGVWTGLYAAHPITKQPLPVWIADYVLATYGTGAIMAVPAHDQRDYTFAKRFQLPIVAVIADVDLSQVAYEEKQGTLIQSMFLDGLSVQQAMQKMLERLQALQIGKQKINYRLRNTIFSRQRYWGEPIPIYYKDNLPHALSTDSLPLTLPSIARYQPSSTGEAPLATIPGWHISNGEPLETNTMPGWAGSSWYFFRYMDPNNSQTFVDPTAQAYWQAVDLYIGGSEHATGHLLYARFWTKFLYDRGYVQVDEPFQQLIHQGMIQHKAYFVYRIKGTNQFVSYNLREQYETVSMYVANHLVTQSALNLTQFKHWRPDLQNASFILEGDQYICGSEIEKMSKSKYNTVNPDIIIEQYGADTLRLYILFLGPIDQAKPWDTHGIIGIYRFLNKIWRLFHMEGKPKEQQTTPLNHEAALRVLHKTIKKVEEDIQRYAFNTAISHLMICVNELTILHYTHRTIFEPFLILLAPFAPHIAEELWQQLGHTNSITHAPFPTYEERYIQDTEYTYPIAINGKVRAQITLSLTASQETIETATRNHPQVQRWIEGQPIKKVIVIHHKMVNLVT